MKKEQKKVKRVKRTVEVIVRLSIDMEKDVDVATVLSEMDYNFVSNDTRACIYDTEIVDVNTEM